MTRSPTRRRYLTAGTAVGIAAVAGCSDLVEDFDEDEGPNEDDENGDQEPVEDVDHENPDGELEFVEPEDGDEVTAPVEIELDVEEFELQPAEDTDNGDDEEDTEEDNEAASEDAGAPEDGAGHLHVLVDHDCMEPGYVIPHEEEYRHLEDGGTEIELGLESGEYELCAQASDDLHNAYDMTDEITVEVDEDDDADAEDGNDNADAENGDE